VRPLHAVFICSSPRTGSGVLCSALWSTDLCGRPDEYLGPGTRREYETAWGCTGNDAYAGRVVEYATTPNGVFSMKVHAEHLGLGRRLRRRPSVAAAKLGPYVTAASRVHFYLLSRRDKVRQAVSLHLARETGRYRTPGGGTATPTEQIPFSATTIRDLVGQIERWHADWDRYFIRLGVEPTRIWYEDDVERNYADTAIAVLEAVGIKRPPDVHIASEYRKQADAVSEAFVQRFREAEGRAGRG
jgi:trehalose 2-sulfotransferase